MSRKFKLCALAAGLLAAAPLAQAFEGGDFILRAGVVNVTPDDSSDSITVGGAPLLGAGTNAQVTVDDDNQLGLRATYMLTDHFGIGVLGATPFKHDINGGGDIPSNLKLAETKHLPPTLTLQYYPLNSNSAFQPFAGVGVNYTIFFEEKTTSTLDGALGVGSSELELDDSVGLALEAGFDYMLNDNFGLNAAIWWADINTDASVKVYDGAGNFVAETDEFEVELDPMVYMVGFTYKF
ncbi:outer membrane beta-barrel protein [Marinobacter salinexigens]|uniref:Outer membrane beta-barrel protein n=1 Tax=Marinobacter salinexigens TaxID=2919747 RepID=A0A5B0VEL1_9GAMM|nr:OmpW family outer membrane protein [Marinobacter salinexigens]KAA1172818.1 outer membrane beta-barrel protein [Marinobacter salinexigens]